MRVNKEFFRALPASLFKPIDIASLVFFRIAFGIIMYWDAWSFFDKGWIKASWIEPIFLFKYYGFSWVHPWPGEGMYIHFLVLGISAFFISIGFLYRISAVIFFLGWTYMFLLDQTHYLNHFYLICLISFLMIFVPAHRSFSIDAWWRKKIRSETVPAWPLWLLRAQFGIAYFYAGVAKLNGDWLMGQPMRMWLHNRNDFSIIGPLFDMDWVVYLFSYGGLLLDLSIVPLLLWKRTRLYIFLAALFFHLMNAWLFDIGVFPWLMIGATLMFFEPDWPRRFLGGIRKKPKQQKHVPTAPTQLVAGQRLTLVLIGIYIAFQLLVPLRHFLYPGNVSWTEEGHRFSWHMKLRSKLAISKFYATDPTSNKTWEINLNKYLNPKQIRKMSAYPDMILQFSHYLADELRKEGYENIEIRARVLASLNYRKPQYFVDPEVNLAGQTPSIWPDNWIMPLQGPLPLTREQVNLNFGLLASEDPLFEN
ncbi:MAG: HTTM domain-containing protein [Thermodesulfobacteriota bacterium]